MWRPAGSWTGSGSSTTARSITPVCPTCCTGWTRPHGARPWSRSATMGEYAVAAESVDGSGMRFGVVVARFNEDITEPLLDGVLRTFTQQGVAEDSVGVVRVPGAFELPLVAQQLARSGTVDGVVCLGAVIR